MKNTALILLLSFAAAVSAQEAAKVQPPELITVTKPAARPSAEIRAESLMESLNVELLHRVQIHQQLWDVMWREDDGDPADVLAAVGTQATLLFRISAENRRHLDTLAKMVGKTLADFLPVKYHTTPRELVFHEDGRVTLK